MTVGSNDYQEVQDSSQRRSLIKVEPEHQGAVIKRDPHEILDEIEDVQVKLSDEIASQLVRPTGKGEILFSCIGTLIKGVSELTNLLRVLSISILATDLNVDSYLNSRLASLHLKQIRASMTSKERNVYESFNQKVMMQQAFIQARMKAHQNQEQMDIQSASSTTSNIQQLSSFIGEFSGLITKTSDALIGMNRV